VHDRDTCGKFHSCAGTIERLRKEKASADEEKAEAMEEVIRLRKREGELLGMLARLWSAAEM
jgi:predicted nuclease with TOPRIM domain